MYPYQKKKECKRENTERQGVCVAGGTVKQMGPGFKQMSQDAPVAFRSCTHIPVSAYIAIWDRQRYQENLSSHQVSGEILSHYSGPSRAGSRFWLPRLGDCKPWPFWWL